MRVDSFEFNENPLFSFRYRAEFTLTEKVAGIFLENLLYGLRKGQMLQKVT